MRLVNFQVKRVALRRFDRFEARGLEDMLRYDQAFISLDEVELLADDLDVEATLAFPTFEVVKTRSRFGGRITDGRWASFQLHPRAVTDTWHDAAYTSFLNRPERWVTTRHSGAVGPLFLVTAKDFIDCKTVLELDRKLRLTDPPRLADSMFGVRPFVPAESGT